MTSTNRIMPFAGAKTSNVRSALQSSNPRSKVVQPFKPGKVSPESIPLFLHQIEAAQSMEGLEDILKAYFKDIGVRMWSYRHTPPLGSNDYNASRIISSFYFPESWCNYYHDQKLCVHDPVYNPVIKEGRLFTWEEVLIRAQEIDGANEYISRIKAMEVPLGLAIPAYGANHRTGIFMIGFEDHISALDKIEMATLRWVCQIAHHKYTHFIENRTYSDVSITNREAEILKWVSLGKSNREIADIVGISRHTVNAYIRSTFSKLDVYERVSASLRAIALGLI